MSIINSTIELNITDSSINIKRNNSDFSRKSKLKKFKKELIDNFSTKENQDVLNTEKTLINFYGYCLDSYNKKLYSNLLKDIDKNQNLLYIGTKESFNIFIIEIKCLMKLMKEKYESELNEITYGKMSVNEYIINIEKEFEKINSILKRDDYYEYETLTQIYCKFLIYLIIFCKKKEEFFKSLAYITLGINMIKIFFIRKKVTKNIKLYKRYIDLLILLINHLIDEGNFTQALIYCENILRILESAIKVLYINDNKYSTNKKNKYLMEFIRCSGFLYIYIGLCHEFSKKEEIAIEAYKQAFYFFTKLLSPKFQEVKSKDEIIFYDNNFVKLSHWFLHRLKTKINYDKKTRDNIRTILFLKAIELKKEKNIEKNKKLKLISIGLNQNQKKYNLIEDKLYKSVLNTKNNNLIEKLDNALIDIAYERKKNNNEDKSKKISKSIMESMCHYKIYNKLMTPNYRYFLMRNNDIKLNNPKDQENFIHKVNTYIAQDMEIKPRNSKKTKIILKADKISKNKNIKFLSSSNLINVNKIFTSTNNSSEKNITNKTNKFDNLFNSMDTIFPNKIKNSKKLSLKKNFALSSLKLEVPTTISSNIIEKNIISKSLSDNNYLTSNKSNSENNKIKSKIKLKKDISIWSKDIYLNKNYFKNFMNLDKLIKKELNFHKDILNMKGNNSKLYNDSFQKEIFTKRKDKEQELNQDYILINEKIEQKVINNQKDYEKLIYYNIRKKQNLKSKNSSEISINETLDSNKNFNYTSEEIKNFNEINKKSLRNVNEKLRGIIYKMRERKKLLRRLNNSKSTL